MVAIDKLYFRLGSEERQFKNMMLAVVAIVVVVVIGIWRIDERRFSMSNNSNSN